MCQVNSVPISTIVTKNSVLLACFLESSLRVNVAISKYCSNLDYYVTKNSVLGYTIVESLGRSLRFFVDVLVVGVQPRVQKCKICGPYRILRLKSVVKRLWALVK